VRHNNGLSHCKKCWYGVKSWSEISDIGEVKQMADAGFFTGRATEIDVGDHGPNSEFRTTGIFFDPTKGGVPRTFAVEMDTEPQVFSGKVADRGIQGNSRRNDRVFADGRRDAKGDKCEDFRD
jgi:hypothetical protein